MLHSITTSGCVDLQHYRPPTESYGLCLHIPSACISPDWGEIRSFTKQSWDILTLTVCSFSAQCLLFLIRVTGGTGLDPSSHWAGVCSGCVQLAQQGYVSTYIGPVLVNLFFPIYSHEGSIIQEYQVARGPRSGQLVAFFPLWWRTGVRWGSKNSSRRIMKEQQEEWRSWRTRAY